MYKDPFAGTGDQVLSAEEDSDRNWTEPLEPGMALEIARWHPVALEVPAATPPLPAGTPQVTHAESPVIEATAQVAAMASAAGLPAATCGTG